MTNLKRKFPKVIFVNDYDSQVNYLCALTRFLVFNHYQKRDFLVLPYLIKGATSTVYFPDLPYPKKFWREIRRINKNVGDVFPKKVTDLVKAILPKNVPLLPKYHLPQKFWQEMAKTNFLDKNLKEITVLVTPFGPGSSFRGNFLTFRADRDLKDLPRSIISLLVSQKSKNYWQNRYYSQFLTNESSLRQFCPPLSRPQLTEKDYEASASFFKKLNLGQVKKLKLINLKHFSKQENLIVKELLLGKLLTHDRMAEILWGPNAAEKYSLWAMTKLVQKLRQKIKKYGGDPNEIKTAYGKGYINPRTIDTS
jgi:hypothetical protein